MSRKVAILICILATLVIAAAGCNKLSSMKLGIPGKVAGQVLNAAGQGQGLVSVQLCNPSGEVVQQMTAEDSGNFLFDKVDTGEYTIKILDMGGGEMPTDAQSFKLGAGKTVSLVITLVSREEAAAGEGGE